MCFVNLGTCWTRITGRFQDLKIKPASVDYRTAKRNVNLASNRTELQLIERDYTDFPPVECRTWIFAYGRAKTAPSHISKSPSTGPNSRQSLQQNATFFLRRFRPALIVSGYLRRSAHAAGHSALRRFHRKERDIPFPAGAAEQPVGPQEP
jgi:hypothetical protein